MKTREVIHQGQERHGGQIKSVHRNQHGARQTYGVRDNREHHSTDNSRSLEVWDNQVFY